MIESFIGIGRENAISQKDLSTCTGLSAREVRKAVEVARSERGALIASDEAWYYFVATEAELKRSRIHTGKRALRPFIEKLSREEVV